MWLQSYAADFPPSFPYSTSISAFPVESVCHPSAQQHPKAHQADSSLQLIRFASSLNYQGATCLWLFLSMQVL